MADHANNSKRHRGETFLFTSESVGEGHPGALELAREEAWLLVLV